jgi:hypothetical protein
MRLSVATLRQGTQGPSALSGVFCPTPQRGIFQDLACEVLRDWSLCQGLNDR